MAGLAQPFATQTRRTITDSILGWASLVLLGVVLVALWRGRAQWGTVPIQVWAHLATILPALALTPAMLSRPKGTRSHRQLGYVWLGLLVATALISFTIRLSRHGQFSLIHLISIYVLVMSWAIVQAARRHRIDLHRRRVRGMVIGALLVAGFFTFPFGRLLGTWLFGT